MKSEPAPAIVRKARMYQRGALNVRTISAFVLGCFVLFLLKPTGLLSGGGGGGGIGGGGGSGGGGGGGRGVFASNALEAHQAARRLPSSYSTLFAGERGVDAVLFLTSLSVHHPSAHVYISTDSDTYEWFLEHAKVLFYSLNLHWTLGLDKYNMKLKREEMEKQNTWNGFMLEKVDIMEQALMHHNDTLLLDADFVLLEAIELPPSERGYQLGISPHYMKESECRKYGRYNGGMLWTNQYGLGEAWRRFTATSYYFEQAAIEDLARTYPYFEFGPEHNLGFWRPVHADKGLKEFYTHLYFDGATQSIMLRNQSVATVHTHILTKYPYDVGNKFSDVFVEMMAMSKRPVYAHVSSVIQWARGGFNPPQLAI